MTYSTSIVRDRASGGGRVLEPEDPEGPGEEGPISTRSLMMRAARMNSSLDVNSAMSSSERRGSKSNLASTLSIAPGGVSHHRKGEAPPAGIRTDILPPRS